jgi:hypothetical protein
VNRRVRFFVLAAVFTASTIPAAGQVGGKLVTGNPTPGTEQPAPPNVADRITLTGCLRQVPGGSSGTALDANTPSDARFALANAERVGRVPPGTGGSPLTTSVSGRSFRLSGIDSQFSPFVDTTVEVSGEISSPAGGTESSTPTLIVEFVQKVASTCK